MLTPRALDYGHVHNLESCISASVAHAAVALRLSYANRTAAEWQELSWGQYDFLEPSMGRNCQEGYEEQRLEVERIQGNPNNFCKIHWVNVLDLDLLTCLTWISDQSRLEHSSRGV